MTNPTDGLVLIHNSGTKLLAYLPLSLVKVIGVTFFLPIQTIEHDTFKDDSAHFLTAQASSKHTGRRIETSPKKPLVELKCTAVIHVVQRHDDFLGKYSSYVRNVTDGFN